MTIIEIENTFAEFSSQLQSLKERYTNKVMTEEITKLIRETQVIKLKVMRLNSENEKNNPELMQSVSHHISDLHQQIVQLKQSFKKATFEA